jgi:hypothetical protein
MVSLTPVRMAFSSKDPQIIWLASTHDRKKFINKEYKILKELSHSGYDACGFERHME